MSSTSSMMLNRKSFRKIAEFLSDAIIETDSEGKIVWTNKAFHDLCGHSKSFVKNKKPGSFLQGPDTDLKEVEKIRQAIRKKEAVQAELINYHQDGHPYWVSLHITPIKDAADQLAGFIAVERDTTEDRCREHALQEQVGQLYSTLVRVLNEEQ